MPPPVRPYRLPILLLAALSATLIPDPARGQSVERIVYATVLDRAGAPVADLAASDFVVRENNVEREVLRISPATSRSRNVSASPRAPSD